MLGDLLWTPDPSPTISRSIDVFKALVESKYSIILPNYADLHRWSINNISAFWGTVYSFTNVIASIPYTKVLKDLPMDEILGKSDIWFKGARFNWAENMLRSKDERIATVEFTEPLNGSEAIYYKTSFAELHYQVYLVAQALRSTYHIQPEDIVAFYGPNSHVCLVLMLAVTSIGAVFSSGASDFGVEGILDRFSSFGEKLKMIVGVESVRYNGKELNQRSKLAAVVEGLKKVRTTKLPVIVFDYLRTGKGAPLAEGELKWEKLMELGKASSKGVKPGEEIIEYTQLPFEHPLFVLFSSGTTGKPKLICHSAGGLLLQSLKEHILHGGVTKDDVFFYYTTPGWMMLQYLYSALSQSCTLVLFDGSPLSQPDLLWKATEDLGISIFGTSAKYIDVLSKNYVPKGNHDLSSLKQLLSTGSPLKSELFEWCYENIKKDLLVGSITGGTDICSLFASHNVSLPVYSGEIQCISLGMAVESWSEEGIPTAQGIAGELVCTKPFTAMPVYFYNDVGQVKYRSAYFEKFDGVWAHGDFIMITPEQGGNGGGLEMRGRSDGILNPGGIRFGSSEIYEVLDTFSPTSSNSSAFNIIEDSLVIAQKYLDLSDERVILFVKMIEGEILTEELKKEIKMRIRIKRTARHVPERFLAVKDIPMTVNLKKVEIPIKKLLNGATLKDINYSTLKNPECLQEYVDYGIELKLELESQKA